MLNRTDLKVGDRIFVAEDNCTIKFDSFRVSEIEVTMVTDQMVYGKNTKSSEDRIEVYDDDFVAKNVFSNKKNAEARIEEMKRENREYKEKKNSESKEQSEQKETEQKENGKEKGEDK